MWYLKVISPLVLLVSGACLGQTDDPPAIRQIIQEFQEAEEAWGKELVSWKGVRKRLRSEGRLDELPPSPQHPFARFAPRVTELARARSGTHEAAVALAFLFAPSRRSDPYAHPGYAAGAKLALITLASDHIEDSVIADVARRMANRRYLIDDVGLDPIASFGTAVRASKQSQQTKAYASYALASAWHRLAGKTGIEARRLELVRSARALFAEVSAAPVGVYKDLAARFVSEIDTVQIGMPAVATSGEDASGKPLRLADFKGKVVLLDFWGFW